VPQHYACWLLGCLSSFLVIVHWWKLQNGWTDSRTLKFIELLRTMNACGKWISEITASERFDRHREITSLEHHVPHVSCRFTLVRHSLDKVERAGNRRLSLSTKVRQQRNIQDNKVKSSLVYIQLGWAKKPDCF